MEDQENLIQDEQLFVGVKHSFYTKFIQNLNNRNNSPRKPSIKKSFVSSKKRSSDKKTSMEKKKRSHHRRSTKQEIIINGNRIIAQWQDDKIHGYVRGIFKNGIKTEGHFIYVDGFQYIGQCEGNKFKGSGRMIFPSGKVISGTWQEYNLIGIATIDYSKNQKYIGQIYNLKKHGKGQYIFKDGSRFVGEFFNGMINGQGTYYRNNKVVSSGVWINGQLTEKQKINQNQNRRRKSQKFFLQHFLIVNDETFFEMKHNDAKKEQQKCQVIEGQGFINFLFNKDMNSDPDSQVLTASQKRVRFNEY